MFSVFWWLLCRLKPAPPAIGLTDVGVGSAVDAADGLAVRAVGRTQGTGDARRRVPTDALVRDHCKTDKKHATVPSMFCTQFKRGPN